MIQRAISLLTVICASTLAMAQAPLSAAPLSAYEIACQHFVQKPSHESDTVRFHDFLTLDWQHQLEINPEFATYAGEKGYNDRWSDLSRVALDLHRRELDCPVQAMATIHRDQLKPADQLSYDLFVLTAQDNLQRRRFPTELIVIDQLDGPHQMIPSLLESMPTESVQDYENIISRLERTPQLIEQEIELMREGLRRQIVPPKIVMREVPRQIQNVMSKNIEESALYVAFRHMSLPEAERTRLQLKAKKVIQTLVYPAFERLHLFVVTEYLPKGRDTIAWESLPDGKAWYSANVRMHTTTRMSPEEIHQLGLAEVKRIRGEMEQAKAATGFKGNSTQFKEFLRTDPRFFFKSKEALLMNYRDIAKRVDPELAKVFGRLPRNTYGVKPVPTYAEKSQTTAYYEPGSPQAGRPGYFFANTYDLKARPKWEMEALTLHEAVPGHHLQMSLEQELENVPAFRRYNDYTAFVEGWGLYAEGLGPALGLYQDPYSNFGRLTYEMWRACRLVVDTGMHHLGWSREQAIQFMLENTPKTRHDVEVEVDRYITWPGQALAYKIGELTFKRLRLEAQKQLGAKFDIKKFHDTLLGEGSLPMEIVEQRMHQWIAKSLND